MKLEGKTIAVQGNIGLSSKKATIDEANMGKLWDILQDPYKNPIGAVVREYVSNCFDSHAEAKFIKENSLEDIRKTYPVYNKIDDTELVQLKQQLQVFNDDAVFVNLKTTDDKYEWTAEDFGVGLSPQRIEDVFCSYLTSTKEHTNDVIGAFGIGSKSGLSYVDVLFIRTRYNGTEYQYMLRKGEEGPQLDTLSIEPTTERNGTEIKINIKDYSDYYDFKQECREQLAYFDNVYFGPECKIENDYKLLEGKNWIASSNGNPYNGLHLCLGKVAYPIDWDNLGIDQIYVDVALKFEIGELDIIPTREDVKYSAKTKAAIIAKIEALRQEIKAKWEGEGLYKIEDIKEYYDKINYKPFAQFTNADNSFTVNINIQELFGEDYSGYVFTPFEKVGLEPPKNYSILFFEYYVAAQITHAGLRKIDEGRISVHLVMNKEYYKFRGTTPYRIIGNHEPKKSKYILEEIVGDAVPLIRKRKSPLKHYIKYLHLKENEKHLWRQQITTFQKVMSQHITDNTRSYEDVVVDPEWLKTQYKARTTFDNKKFVVNLLDSFVWGARWDKNYWVKGDIDSSNRTLFIMGTKEQREELKTIGRFYNNMYPKLRPNSKLLKVGYAAPTNLQYLEDVQNLITVGNFKKTRAFQRAMTVYHVNHKVPELAQLISIMKIYNPDLWDNINVNYSKRLAKASEYLKLNHHDFVKNLAGLFHDGYEYLISIDGLDKDYIEELHILNEYIQNLPLVASQILRMGQNYIGDMRMRKQAYQDLAREIVKIIVMHNHYVKKNQRKKINAYYYALFNANEMSWMSGKDKELIKYIQRPKLKL